MNSTTSDVVDMGSPSPGQYVENENETVSFKPVPTDFPTDSQDPASASVDAPPPMSFPQDRLPQPAASKNTISPDNLPELIRSTASEALSTYRQVMAMSLPRKKERWAFAAFLTVIFLLRVLISRKWIFIAYCLYVYILSRVIMFVTPMVEPDDDDVALPTYDNDEYRPFVSRLPEFTFWQKYVEGHGIAIVLTLTTWTNIPVVWQILVVYFILLAGLSIGKEVVKMRKFKYAPDWPILRKIVGIASKPKFNK